MLILILHDYIETKYNPSIWKVAAVQVRFSEILCMAQKKSTLDICNIPIEYTIILTTLLNCRYRGPILSNNRVHI